MNYKSILLIFCILLSGCINPQKSEIINENKFKFYSNKGFTLIYKDDLLENNIVDNSIDSRSLIVFNDRLTVDTPVKITNMLNGKNLLARIGVNSKYPSFYNSVISKRIADELQINLKQPYIKIQTIANNSSFIANEAITFDEEKKVANKAPVENIIIENISVKKDSKKNIKKKNELKMDSEFKYIIKFADLYFEESAFILKNRLIDEFKLKNVKINKISKNSFRVFLGPFSTLDSIRKSFESINVFYFDNLEIVKL